MNLKHYMFFEMFLVASMFTACRFKSTESAELKSSESTYVPALETDIGPTLSKSESANPKVVEVTLNVQEATVDLGLGAPVLALTYNGVVPGPTIVANVGDELILHVKNSSKFPTILHPHGFELPHQYDGTHLSQAPIPQGGVFTHKFKLRHPGTFWYHSHHDGAVQIGRGLYGAIIVHGPGEPHLTERAVVISQVTKDGAPTSDNNLTEEHSYLVNGKAYRESKIRPGESLRYRIINATSNFIVDFRLSNGQPMTLISRGPEMTDQPYPLNHINLEAGERADIVITAPENSQTPIDIIADPVPLLPRGVSPPLDAISDVASSAGLKDPRNPVVLMRLNIVGTPTKSPAIPSILAKIPDPEKINFAATRDFSISMVVDSVGLDGIGSNGLPAINMGARFPINSTYYPDTPKPTETLGTWVLHRWKNASPSPHPIHVHGFKFIVISRNGVKENIRSWQDTADLPPFGELEYALYLDGFPGEWLYHCHFEGHMVGGTMGSMIVVDPKNSGSLKLKGTPGATLKN